MTLQVANGSLKPLGYQQISAATLAAATSLTVPAGARYADISQAVAAASVRYRDDGTAPTAAVGMSIGVLAYPLRYTGDLTKIQFILSTGSPILDISYYADA